MAMRENLRNLEVATNTTLRLQQQKEVERKKKQEETQYKKRLEFEIKNILRKTFEHDIYEIGSCCANDFYMINKKKELLEFIKSELLETKIITFKNGETLQTYDTQKEILLEEYYNKYYYKILKTVTNEKIEDEKANFWNSTNNIEIQTEKKTVDWIAIIKIIGIIIFLPFVFIAAILFGTMKNSK